VAERLAAGGTVFFVDHHQARLAGMVSQRWQLGSGDVQVLDGPGAVAAERDTDAAPVVIEIAGLEPESQRQLAVLPGVGDVRPVPGTRADGKIAVRVEVAARDSDDLLRQVLSWDDVHVVGVRAAP
jgi:hypothetical protein